MSRNPNWTLTEIEFLKANWLKMGAQEIADKLNRPLRAAQVKASRLGFTRKDNIILWTDDEIKFLKENFQRLNSFQLAAALGKKRTIVRMKYAELGLAKMKLEYWNKEMVQFLRDHYKTTGDVEMAKIFQQKFPKNKKWTKQHIMKKRMQLNLLLTKKEWFDIVSKQATPGSKSSTILKNSSSVSLHDSWVAQMVVGPRSKNAQEIIAEVLKQPELIKLKRAQILLNRELKKKTAA